MEWWEVRKVACGCLCGAEVNHAALRPHHEQRLLFLLEGYGPPSYKRGGGGGQKERLHYDKMPGNKQPTVGLKKLF